MRLPPLPENPLISTRLSSRMILLAAAALLAACVWAGCTGGKSPAPVAPVSPAASGETYAGSEACAECHPEIYARQVRSNHALTLRATPGDWLQARTPKPVRLKDTETGLEYTLDPGYGSGRQLVLKGDEVVAEANLDYLLGSGHHGVSPMSFDGSTWRYLSLTHYAAHGWDFSPMHDLGDAEARRKNAQGWPVSAEEVEKCFGCHSTRLAFQGPALDTTRSELGVRCESCHGPGKAHVEAARRKTADLAIQNPRKWSAENYTALCEQCHNETATLEGTLMGIPDDPASPSTVKYHVYGLGKSRCFTESDGRLRCSTCHDPHASSETRPAFYEAKCLSCHSGGAADRKPCPVNPRSGCLPCHMPKVKVEKYTYFADHWIRAKSPFAKQTAARRP